MYLAEDQGRFNERCAIKELIPPATSAYALEKSKELFQREAQILYQIQHPQIPQFRATFEEDGRFFIVQDYVEGKTYRDRLDERKAQGYVFSEAEVTDLLDKTLPVLGYLHGEGIIHRDIAPDNIIQRDRDQAPVLIDFGVVKELATRIQMPGTTQQATTVGKVGYAPTEQMQTGRAYPNSDLYALAVSAIVLLTGREPQDLLDDSTMTWHWQRWAAVSPGFAQVINRMLNYMPNQRYQSATDVQQALSNLGQSTGVATVAPNPAPNPAPATQSAPSPVAVPNPAVPNPPVGADSRMATVAVGRPAEVRSRDDYDGPGGRRAKERQAGRSSVWDDPWAAGSIVLGLMLLAGIGGWVAYKSFQGGGTPAVVTPTPPAPLDTPTPKLTPTPTPTPTPKPVEFSKSLKLAPDQPATTSASLEAGQTFNLLFDAKEGQTLDAKLGGEGVLMTVLGPDGKPVEGDKSKRVSFWNGPLPLTGSYTLQMGLIRGLAKGDFKLDATLSNPAPVPTITPTVTPTVTASPTTPPSPGGSTIDQVIFDGGSTSKIVSGTTIPGGTKSYQIQARADQIMEVKLRGEGRMNLLYPNNSPIEEAVGVSSWSGQLPKNGVYRIDVVAQDAGDFELEISIK